MRFYRVDVEKTTGPEWLRIPAALRGHWHALVSYCAMRENGGVIEGAAEFTNRDWDRIAGVTRATIRALVDAGLARWVDAQGEESDPDGPRTARERPANDPGRGALEILGYDVESEDRVAALRKSAVKAAKSRWSRDANGNADGNAKRNADGNAIRNARREEKRRDGSRSDASASDPPPELELTHPGPPTPKLPRADDVVEAFAEGAGLRFVRTTPTKGHALSLEADVRELAKVGLATVDAIREAGRYVAGWERGRKVYDVPWLASEHNLERVVKGAHQARLQPGPKRASEPRPPAHVNEV